MMYLIQLFLPLYDEKGLVVPEAHFASVRDQLTERFGGITTYSRAPARGFWKDKGEMHKDDISCLKSWRSTSTGNGGMAIDGLWRPDLAKRRY